MLLAGDNPDGEEAAGGVSLANLLAGSAMKSKKDLVNEAAKWKKAYKLEKLRWREAQVELYVEREMKRQLRQILPVAQRLAGSTGTGWWAGPVDAQGLSRRSTQPLPRSQQRRR